MQMALLEVATSLLTKMSLRNSRVRSLLVGAWLRLHGQHPSLTKRAFCQKLALSERTFRQWVSKTSSQSEECNGSVLVEPKQTKRRKRSPRRGRFGFEVTVPGLQQAADTTDLSAFGVPLKLMATQDIGGRDANLFDAVIVDDHENAELVSKMFTEALQGKQGVQVLTDQGSPYLANLTRQVLRELGAEHAVQREGMPTDKATVERAFRTVKQILKPLLKVTNKLADCLPDLRSPELAKAGARIVLTAMLRAYQAGARAARVADHARADVSCETLKHVAKQAREQAHKETESARLLLTDIHQLYDIQRPLQKFINGLHLYPLPVLNQAECSFRSQVHRDDIRNRASYFARLVRNHNVDYQRRKAAEDRAQQQSAQHDIDRRARERQLAAWQKSPVEWMQAGLKFLLQQWLPEQRCLVADGLGIGRVAVRGALSHLVEMHGPLATIDITSAILKDFAERNAKNLGEAGTKAIQSVVSDLLNQVAPTTTSSAPIPDFIQKLRTSPLVHPGPMNQPTAVIQ